MQTYKFKEFDQFLRWSGFNEIRQTGSHHIYKRGNETCEPIPNVIEEPIARRLIKKYNLCTSKKEYKNRLKENKFMMMINRENVAIVSNGMEVKYKGKSTISPVEYIGKVTEVYKNHIVILVAPTKLNCKVWGDPNPYRISVNINSLGIDEFLYV